MSNLSSMPRVTVSESMLAEGRRLEASLKVERTQESDQDSLIGILGELAFVEWFMGDWKHHRPSYTKGKADLGGIIELKSSARPMGMGLNLVVREDYAEKRSPEAYVQMIIDVPRPGAVITAGMTCFISGFTGHARVMRDPPEHLGSQKNSQTGFKSYLVPIRDLDDMSEFPFTAEKIKTLMSKENMKGAFAKMAGRGSFKTSIKPKAAPPPPPEEEDELPSPS